MLRLRARPSQPATPSDCAATHAPSPHPVRHTLVPGAWPSWALKWACGLGRGAPRLPSRLCAPLARVAPQPAPHPTPRPGLRPSPSGPQRAKSTHDYAAAGLTAPRRGYPRRGAQSREPRAPANTWRVTIGPLALRAPATHARLQTRDPPRTGNTCQATDEGSREGKPPPAVARSRMLSVVSDVSTINPMSMNPTRLGTWMSRWRSPAVAANAS